MLIQFTVGNFRSFRDKATLSLEATNDDWMADDNVATASGHRLVKAAGIHGANAGGKSNFLKAMEVFRRLVLESSKNTQQGEPIPVTPFRLHTTSEHAPSFFELVFLHKAARYRYGFEASREAIVSEWLFRQGDSIRETRLFTRDEAGIDCADTFKEGKGLEARTRANALFLSVASQFNGEVAGEIMNWMQNFRNVSGLDDAAYMNFTTGLLGDPAYGPLIRALVKQADTGIADLKRQEIPPEKLTELIPGGLSPAVRDMVQRHYAGGFFVKTVHQRFDAEDRPAGTVEFNLKEEESAGTQKFVALAGPFLHTLRKGAVLFVDELEARLHPLLTKALLELFNSSGNRNNAQLIFTTHDEALLDPKRIRRDQVWFVEKDRMGSSRLYSLDEIKGVRKGDKFAKEYLLGQFGAVPRVGDFQAVLDHAHD